MKYRIHTTDIRLAQRLWHELGGSATAVRGTGEMRYRHPDFADSIRANNRRRDVPAVLLCRINKLLAARSAVRS